LTPPSSTATLTPVADAPTREPGRALVALARELASRLGDLNLSEDLSGRESKAIVDDETALSANVITFRNGKIIEMVHYPSPQDARAAAGV